MEALRIKEFGQRWIDWMSTCVYNGKSCILLNDRLGIVIFCCRGLRHGNLLFPLIFTLVADVLTMMINRGREQGLLQGVVPSSLSGGISILQDADDTLLFWSNNINEALALKWILNCFEEWSGLRINFHKSSLLPLGGRSEMTIQLASIFNCVDEYFPIQYLAVPLRPGTPKRSDWLPLIKKNKRKLAGWKGNVCPFGDVSLSSIRCFSPFPYI